MSGIETNNVVERLERFAETLSVNRHYMTAQTCMEVQNDLRALLTERQSLSDRIDVLEGVLIAAKPLVGSYGDHFGGTDTMVRSSLHVSKLIERALQGDR